MNEVHPGLIALLIIAPMILAMIVQCCIAHKYTERFESFLTNCIFVTGNKNTFQHAGLLGKVMRTGLISMVLAVPKIFVRRGLIDIDEVKRFPPRMRRLLVSLLGIHIVLLTALAIFNYAQR
ncbi:hypothetical protein D3C76_801030 [compost metagenome]|uniref:Transmembrane protein n=1 Tax=Pseudomonas fluorescens TaxID=294 RepID=A0A5E7UL92_PSEFL|nr:MULTISPECIES: hypothetical protein [Pseudomonas]PBJ27878.1 hypothetical protein BSF44_01110 [Pseudomonas sp. ACN8]VVQ11179.1 hypothetical protein PS938_03629 [Pseudomonas fluorescens]